jgi:hypothetical protein
MRIMTLDLRDDETQVLVQHLKHAIDNDPYPLSPRLLRLKAILGEAQTGADLRALAAAEGVCTAVRGPRPEGRRAGRWT